VRKHFTKRRVIVLTVVALAAGLGAGAYAYFTTTGSGTGSATVGTSSAVTIHGTTTTTLYPGTSTEVDFTIDNPSTGHQFVGTIHLASVSTDAGHSTCVMSDFTMPDVTANQDFPNGNGQAVTAHGTLTMANNGNQDACKDAPLTLHLTSS
jgi:hypothetical protein